MPMSGIVRAICVSAEKGIAKQPVPIGKFLVGWGIENDAHGGNWHRQVSLLSYDKVRDFNSTGARVKEGDFGENLVVEGIDFKQLPVGTVLRCGDVLLELTQIGKECHSHCAIHHRMGDCIMPREGVFARVLVGGTIAPGEVMTAETANRRCSSAAVITLSDKGSKNVREDESGPLIKQMLEQAGYHVIDCLLLPDSFEQLKAELINLSDRRQVDLVLTTGGTGFSRRDVTPEATLAVAERNAAGIAEAIRANSLRFTNRAILSRGESVLRGGTLIVNLPGSPKAVRECLEFILPVLGHGLDVLKGETEECARQ